MIQASIARPSGQNTAKPMIINTMFKADQRPRVEQNRLAVAVWFMGLPCFQRKVHGGCQGRFKKNASGALVVHSGAAARLRGRASGGGPLRRCAAVPADEIGYARHDLVAEARAVEHAVMADGRLQVMLFPVIGEIGAERVGGLGLADAGYVVA